MHSAQYILLLASSKKREIIAKMTFISSSANRMCDMNYEGYMQLQHFIENGMVTTNWNEVNLANIVIAAYEQNESEEFPTVDLSKKLDITLKISTECKQVLINQPIRLNFGEMEKVTIFISMTLLKRKTTFVILTKWSIMIFGKMQIAFFSMSVCQLCQKNRLLK